METDDFQEIEVTEAGKFRLVPEQELDLLTQAYNHNEFFAQLKFPPLENMTPGQLLKLQRTILGRSSSEFAVALKISPAYYRSVETSSELPGTKVLKGVKKLFGDSFVELLTSLGKE
jgi:hypothetical protein